MPDTFYKYRSIENFKNFIDIIINKRLYAAKYDDLNDPMEGLYYYVGGTLNEDRRNLIFNTKQSIRICSLSRTNDNGLMWAHYANGHKGVVIGVRINFDDYDIRPVRYNGRLHISDSTYNENSPREILQNKHEIWQYEEEQRVFTDNEKFVKVEVVEIITGRKMPASDHSLISKLVRGYDQNIRVVKAKNLYPDI